MGECTGLGVEVVNRGRAYVAAIHEAFAADDVAELKHLFGLSADYIVDHPEEALPALLGCISRPDDELSGRAAYALWEIGLPSSFSDWDGLLTLLGHRHLSVRAFIANTLADNVRRLRLTSRQAGVIRRAIRQETREQTREVLRGLLGTPHS